LTWTIRQLAVDVQDRLQATSTMLLEATLGDAAAPGPNRWTGRGRPRAAAGAGRGAHFALGGAGRARRAQGSRGDGAAAERLKRRNMRSSEGLQPTPKPRRVAMLWGRGGR
jgi:hypothetical protein